MPRESERSNNRRIQLSNTLLVFLFQVGRLAPQQTTEVMQRMKQPKAEDQYSDEEASRRMLDAVRRSFTLPYKPRKALVGTTPRAKAMARQKAAKASRKA
jgi:hypothetical protein